MCSSDLQPPLVLRLITLIDGRNRRIDLLTNVLDEKVLPDATALTLYQRRWGVEVIYRSLKQTMGKRKLRCDAPANAVVELQWSVMGLWLLGLMSVSRIVERGERPGNWSVAASLRVVRRVMDGMLRRGLRLAQSLSEALGEAVKDDYLRTGSKQSRHWPDKKKESPPGPPRARMADESQIQLAAELKEKRRDI